MIGNRNRDLPACSAVSHPTAPLRAPSYQLSRPAELYTVLSFRRHYLLSLQKKKNKQGCSCLIPKISDHLNTMRTSARSLIFIFKVFCRQVMY